MSNAFISSKRLKCYYFGKDQARIKKNTPIVKHKTEFSARRILQSGLVSLQSVKEKMIQFCPLGDNGDLFTSLPF